MIQVKQLDSLKVYKMVIKSALHLQSNDATKCNSIQQYTYNEDGEYRIFLYMYIK